MGGFGFWQEEDANDCNYVFRMFLFINFASCKMYFVQVHYVEKYLGKQGDAT